MGGCTFYQKSWHQNRYETHHEMQIEVLIPKGKYLNFKNSIFAANQKLSLLGSICEQTAVKHPQIGRGCGSVGRVVTSYSGDPRFKSSHQQILFTINCIEKTEIKRKEAGNCTFFKKSSQI